MGLPPGRRGKERCKVMNKLQVAHDFSMEVLHRFKETIELLIPIAFLFTILALGITIAIVLLCQAIACIIDLINKRR